MSFYRFSLILAIEGLLLATSTGFAQDKITLATGQVQDGKITGMTSGNVVLTLANGGSISLPLAQVQKVEMAPPRELIQARDVEGAKAAALLEPVLARFKGLPVDWYVEAMGRMADAVAAQGQTDKARAIYEEMAKLYPNSSYAFRAKVGLAKNAFQQGRPDEAARLLEPLIAEAGKKLKPSAEDSAAYADAYLLLGDIQNAQKNCSAALESYLTVIAVFYHNPEVVKSAQQRVAKLRETQPNLSVN